jgi:signal transduction histidine kinase
VNSCGTSAIEAGFMGDCMKRRHSLRSLLTITTGAIAVLSLIAAGTMIWLTAVLHRTTATAASAVESVYLLEEAEIDLLLHARGSDPLVVDNLEASLRDKLAAARSHVSSADEARALDKVFSTIEEYFVKGSLEAEIPAARLAELQRAAVSALEAAVAMNLSQARSQQADAERWSRIADVVGGVLGVVLLVTAGLVVTWLRRRAFQPVLALAEVIRRFGSGDRAVRAEEGGFAELHAMSTTFNEMAQALVTQREAQLALLAGVAHDLRQPLGALVLSMDLLDHAESTAAERRRPIEIARRQLGYLERMVGDFLSLAKLDAAPIELRLHRVDIRDAVRNAVELHDDTPIREWISLTLPAAPVEVRCDPLRIEQVVTNLLSNAIKYSPSGMPIDVVVEQTGNEVAVRVTDRGPGLTADEQSRLFEPFRRVGPAAGVAPGIGLGLFVVRRIVTAHGGRIEIDSERGRGSTFTVYLPVQ